MRRSIRPIPKYWRLSLWATAAMLWPQAGMANPAAPTVTAGEVQFQEQPGRLDVIQNSDKAIVHWESFSIAPDESTHFIQPSASAVILNRVTGGLPSEIAGKLTANGQVFLINPAGVVVARGARVDVQGLVATTADLKDIDFLNRNYVFTVPAPEGSSVQNLGEILVREGGSLILAAPLVRNDGTIEARFARVSLTAAKAMRVDLDGDGLLTYELTATAGARVLQNGLVAADGGVVGLSARSADAVREGVINQDGVVAARSVAVREGKIILDGGERGLVDVRGQVDASGRGQGEVGGSIDVTGDRVALRDGASLDVSGNEGGGRIRFGGDAHGAGDFERARLASVASDAFLRADAGESGAGGQIIVWGDEAAIFNGTASARGGNKGGDGGFIETSSKGGLHFTGKADASATHGKNGTVLLDPHNIFFNSTNGTDNAEVTDSVIDEFDGGPTIDFFIQDTAVEALAGNAIFEALNDITINAALDLTNLGQGERMDFRAGNNVNINAAVTSAGGSLGFFADADFPNQQSDGVGTVTAAAAVSSSGGDIDFSGANGQISAAVNAGTVGKVFLSSSLTNPNFDLDTSFASSLSNISAAEVVVGRDSAGTVVANFVTTSVAVTVPSTVGLLSLRGTQGVTVSQNLSAPNSNLVFDGARGEVQITSTVSTGPTGNLLISADTVTISPTTGQLTSGTVFFTTPGDSTANFQIGPLSQAGDVNIDNNELSRISATNAVSIQGRNITFTGVTSAAVAGIPTFTLSSPGNINFSNAGNTVRSLTSVAGGSTTVSSILTSTGAGGIVLTTDADSFGDEGLQVDSIVTVQAAQNFVFNGPDFDINGSGAVLTTGTGRVIINATRDVTLGSGTGTGRLLLDNLELNRFESSEVAINTLGSFVIDSAGVTSVNIGAYRLTGTTADLIATSGGISFPNLFLTMSNGIQQSASVQILLPNVDTVWDADSNADGVGTFASNGDIAASRDLTIQAATITRIASVAQISHGRNLLLLPKNLTRSIGMGGGAGAFQIPQGFIEGVTSPANAAIIVGLANGQHTITIGGSGVNTAHPLNLTANGTGGTIVVNGPLTGIFSGSLNLMPSSAGVVLTNTLSTEHQPIFINGRLDVPSGQTGIIDTSIVRSVTQPGQGPITLAGPVTGGGALQLVGGDNPIFSNGNITLASLQVTSGADLFFNGNVTATSAQFTYSGFFNDATRLAGFPNNPFSGGVTVNFNVGSLALSSSAQGATLFGTVNGVSGTPAALQVTGPSGNLAFTINNCVIGTDCNAPPMVTPPPPPPSSAPVTNNPAAAPPPGQIAGGVLGGAGVPMAFAPPAPPPPPPSSPSGSSGSAGGSAQGSGSSTAAPSGGSKGDQQDGDQQEGDGDSTGGEAPPPPPTPQADQFFDQGFGGPQTAAYFDSGNSGSASQSFQGWDAFQVPAPPADGMNRDPNSDPPGWPNTENWSAP